MKVAAFVTIKLNSSRLPRKNVLPLGGHPLCWHICDTLLACETIDEIYIYCSDEQVMGYVPQDERLIFRKRSAHLDGDLVRAQEIYSAFVDEVDADVYVAALTTAPFITARSIDAGVHAVLSGAHDSAFSAQSIQTALELRAGEHTAHPGSPARAGGDQRLLRVPEGAVDTAPAEDRLDAAHPDRGRGGGGGHRHERGL